MDWRFQHKVGEVPIHTMIYWCVKGHKEWKTGWAYPVALDETLVAIADFNSGERYAPRDSKMYLAEEIEARDIFHGNTSNVGAEACAPKPNANPKG